MNKTNSYGEYPLLKALETNNIDKTLQILLDYAIKNNIILNINEPDNRGYYIKNTDTKFLLLFFFFYFSFYFSNNIDNKIIKTFSPISFELLFLSYIYISILT